MRSPLQDFKRLLGTRFLALVFSHWVKVAMAGDIFRCMDLVEDAVTAVGRIKESY